MAFPRSSISLTRVPTWRLRGDLLVHQSSIHWVSETVFRWSRLVSRHGQGGQNSKKYLMERGGREIDQKNSELTEYRILGLQGTSTVHPSILLPMPDCPLTCGPQHRSSSREAVLTLFGATTPTSNHCPYQQGHCPSAGMVPVPQCGTQNTMAPLPPSDP